MGARIVLTFCILSALWGCADSKPDQQDAQQGALSAGPLFTLDGVTVYRFGDGSRYHYYAVRTGRADTITVTTWSESCGKNCVRQVQDMISLIADGR